MRGEFGGRGAVGCVAIGATARDGQFEQAAITLLGKAYFGEIALFAGREGAIE
ncbi:hypothetical protein ACGFJ7_09850 [Actinoplanes sp. NPDC048988]|uniref:hypothetical protein n=1 Tax=Actinoplanes sp. NPDC048988 TaxID=3363901 RepID=UPI003711F9CA